MRCPARGQAATFQISETAEVLLVFITASRTQRQWESETAKITSAAGALPRPLLVLAAAAVPFVLR